MFVQDPRLSRVLLSRRGENFICLQTIKRNTVRPMPRHKVIQGTASRKKIIFRCSAIRHIPIQSLKHTGYPIFDSIHLSYPAHPQFWHQNVLFLPHTRYYSLFQMCNKPSGSSCVHRHNPYSNRLWHSAQNLSQFSLSCFHALAEIFPRSIKFENFLCYK